MKVHDLTEVNVDAALEETFTTTTILTEKRNAENQPISVSYCAAVVIDIVSKCKPRAGKYVVLSLDLHISAYILTVVI